MYSGGVCVLATAHGQTEGTYLQAIRYHVKPQQLAGMGVIPAEARIVCDADHLWSFTHANF